LAARRESPGVFQQLHQRRADRVRIRERSHAIADHDGHVSFAVGPAKPVGDLAHDLAEIRVLGQQGAIRNVCERDQASEHDAHPIAGLPNLIHILQRGGVQLISALLLQGLGEADHGSQRSAEVMRNRMREGVQLFAQPDDLRPRPGKLACPIGPGANRRMRAKCGHQVRQPGS
jgi:hypothetical protein